MTPRDSAPQGEIGGNERVSLVAGWWQASDGRWYDPCLAPPGYVPVESADGTRNVVDAIEFIAGTPQSRSLRQGPGRAVLPTTSRGKGSRSPDRVVRVCRSVGSGWPSWGSSR